MRISAVVAGCLLAWPAIAQTPGMEPPLISIGFEEPSALGAKVSGSVRASYLGVQGAPSPLETRVRVGPELRYAKLGAVGEVDLVSGALWGLPPSSEGLGPSSHPLVTAGELRQLYLEYRGESFVVRAGQQTSQWGLGLVANAGGRDAAPGEFGDAHFGDLTWRALWAGRPLYGMGGAWRALEPIVAADVIARDDTARWSDADRAVQGVFALRFNADEEHQGGLYAVYRRQRMSGSTDAARSTDAWVLDASGRWSWGDGLRVPRAYLGFEAAWITGRTTLSRSDTAPELWLQQFGAVAKGSVRLNRWEAYLDLGYASGDQNPYDDTLQGFRFDPDYHAGLLLYQEVLAWQSARTFARASDPDVSGVPPEGVELLPTRGAITGSAYAFPRVRKGFGDWLDVYGGPLVAMTTASMADAFTTRIAGGTPRNSLGGRPGRYLGTELDLGVQARFRPVKGMVLSATAEAGYFLPGNAFTDEAGQLMDPVAAGRLRVGMSF